MKRHFKHVRLATTDGYIGNDQDLYRSVGHFSRLGSLNRLNEIVENAPMIGGAAGVEIKERLQSFAMEFQGSEGKDALRYKIDEHLELAVEAGLTVVDCTYCYCIRRMDNKPQCGGKVARRGPEVCLGCANFAVIPEQRAWWATRVEANEIMLSRHVEASASTTQIAVLQAIVDESKQALAKIDGDFGVEG